MGQCGATKAELFQGTIRSNLILGIRDEVSDNELWRALDIAQASDFVSEKRDNWMPRLRHLVVISLADNVNV